MTRPLFHCIVLAAAVFWLILAAACRDVKLITIEYHRHPAPRPQAEAEDDRQTEQEIIEGLIGGVP